MGGSFAAARGASAGAGWKTLELERARATRGRLNGRQKLYMSIIYVSTSVRDEGVMAKIAPRLGAESGNIHSRRAKSPARES